MDQKPNRHTQYVGRVHDDTQRIITQLMADNERLRTIAAEVERDRELLRGELASLTAELERRRQREESLAQQLRQIESESRSFAAQVAEVEQRSANLANLYVSSYQLHGTVERETVLAAISEILVNLIGSEHFAVFERSGDGDAFQLVTSFGLEPGELQKISASDPVGSLISAGETYLAAEETTAEMLRPLVACVPLKIDGKVTGGIVIFTLLPQKAALQEIDYELFDLLGSHAATALYCSSLHAQFAGVTA